MIEHFVQFYEDDSYRWTAQQACGKQAERFDAALGK